MIVDIVQKASHIDVSHTTQDGKIVISAVPLPPEGYQNWIICGANDPYRDHKFTHITGEPVKRVRGAKFWDLNLNEFISKRLSPELDERLHSMHMPSMYSVDIETEIIDGFPLPEEAKTRILSFSITAPNMKTIILSLDDKKHELNDDMITYWVNKALEGLTWGKKHIPETGAVWVNKTFPTENAMIEYFFYLMREAMAYIGGWNFKEYDWKYIVNRCAKLGIDVEKGSPEYAIDRETYPIHRIIHDYMEHYKKGAVNADFESYSLETVSQYELGVGKLDYDGLSLKELYERDYSKFIAYAIVDTILVQLIHKKVARTDWVFNMANYMRVGSKAVEGALVQADALCFEEMYVSGQVFAGMKGEVTKEEYKGGYVKQPVRKYSDYPVGYDAKALYPNTIRSLNLSFENYIGKASSPEEARIYLEKGYIVTERMNVYKNDKDYLYRRIQTKLADQRAKFQEIQREIWEVTMKQVEEEAKRRGLTLHKHEA